MTVKHIQTKLGCTQLAAKGIHILISDPFPSLEDIHHILECADAILNTSGVEYIDDKEDSAYETLGISYCNTGDTYTPTLLYDHRRQKWYCCAWGDIVERYPKRFEIRAQL